MYRYYYWYQIPLLLLIKQLLFQLNAPSCHCFQVAVNVASLNTHTHQRHSVAPSFQRYQQRSSRSQEEQRPRIGVNTTPLYDDNTPPSNDHDISSGVIKIYDQVYNHETCDRLHQLTQRHSDHIGDDSSIMYRRTQHKTTTTDNDKDDHEYQFQENPLEYVIDHILTNVCNDTTTNVVEYWSRQTYMNIDVHCDIDEYLFEQGRRQRQQQHDPIVRCPDYAHILYITVQQPGRRTNTTTAPTCIFPTKNGGWIQKNTTTSATDSSRNTDSPDELDHSNTTTTTTTTTTMSAVDLVIVPAVSGRVVRFPGSVMHAVPNPSNQWFDSSTSHSIDAVNDKEDYDDDDDDDQMIRSVLLFNCWSNDMPPPIGLTTYNNFQQSIGGAAAAAVIPDGIVIDDDDDDIEILPLATSNVTIQLVEEDYQSVFAINDGWRSTNIVTTITHPNAIMTTEQQQQQQNDTIFDSTISQTTLRIPLMGNKYRRKHHKAVAKLYINSDDEGVLRQAFNEPVIPTRIQLLQKEE